MLDTIPEGFRREAKSQTYRYWLRCPKVYEGRGVLEASKYGH